MRSYCSRALRTNAKPSSMRSVTRGSSRRRGARPAGTCARCRRPRASISAASPTCIDGCFSSSSAEPPSPPPTISARSGCGMRERRDVHEVLVIEELVPLGRHEMAVEAEQLAERRAVVDLDRPGNGERNALELARRADEEAPVVGQVLGHRAGREVARRRCGRGACRGHRSIIALPPRWIAWKRLRARLQRGLERVEHALGLVACCRSCSCRRRRRP